MTTTSRPTRPTRAERPRTPPPRTAPATPPAASARPGAPASAAGAPDAGPRRVVVVVQRLFAADTREYFLLLGTTLFLLGLGLVMVLSASSISSIASSGNAFARAGLQGLYAVLGLPLMLIAARMPVDFWKRIAPVAVIVALALQLLVIPFGITINGNRNWLSIGGSSVQPSEFLKLALALWLGWRLSRMGEGARDSRGLRVIAPICIVAVGLIMHGGDLGTTVIIAALILGCLVYAGLRMRWLLVVLVLGGVGALVASQLNSSRTNRISAWLSGCMDPSLYAGDCWQTVQGWASLAHGGIFGVGLGNSSGKWSWVPEASNDFIFAILGEELGLIGAVLVLVLFVVLAIAFARIIRRATDPFVRIVTAGIMVWTVGQAFVNIAVVLGVLPVLGVPLPLVSAGGSALISTLFAIGIVLSFARSRPEEDSGIVSPTARTVTRSTPRPVRTPRG